MSDEYKGGIAKGMSIRDIAKKHNVGASVVRKRVDKGRKIETAEHGFDSEIAFNVAKDHILESLEYYGDKKAVKIAKRAKRYKDGGVITTEITELLQGIDSDSDKEGVIKKHLVDEYSGKTRKKIRKEIIEGLTGNKTTLTQATIKKLQDVVLEHFVKKTTDKKGKMKKNNKFTRIKDSDIKAGAIFVLPNGEKIDEIRPFIKTNAVVDANWVGYNRSGNSTQSDMNENSVKSLRLFLNTWKAIKVNPENKPKDSNKESLQTKLDEVNKTIAEDIFGEETRKGIGNY